MNVRNVHVLVHCGSIRQTASILSMSQECLRTGDKAKVHFRFIKHPEYLKAGQRLVFREGRTKAVGNVLKVIPQTGLIGAANKVHVKQNKMLPQSQNQVILLLFVPNGMKIKLEDLATGTKIKESIKIIWRMCRFP